MNSRAFTLLEVIASLIILAGIMTLSALLWAQLAAWGDVQASAQRRLDSAHVERLALRQWDARVRPRPTSAEARPAWRLDRDAFTLVTAVPMLDPAAPLVVARYEITRDPGPGGRARLIYKERTVVDPRDSSVREIPESARPAAGAARSMTLIDDADALRFERYDIRIQSGRLARGWSAPDPSPPTHDRRPLIGGEPEQRVPDPDAPTGRFDAADRPVVPPDGTANGEPGGEPEGPDEPPISVRVTGSAGGKEVSWLLVAPRSR